MADKPDLTLPWYQQKKWVVSAGLVCGAGLGLLLIPPVADEIVPLLLNESSSEPETATPEPAEVEGSETTEPTSAGVDTAATDSASEDAADDADPSADANTETRQPEGPYELVVFNTEEVTNDDLVLIVLSAELNLYPVDKTKLRSALDAEVEQFRSNAHAVSVRVFYDRREGSSPAFGAWEWAPQGDRSKASLGDPKTWDNYEWSEPDLAKFRSPDSCDLPDESELDLSGAYYNSQFTEPEEPTEPLEAPDDPDDPDDGDAPSADDEPVDADGDSPDEAEPTEPTTTVQPAPDPDVMEEAAEEIGTTAELLSDALLKTSKWAAC